MRTVLENRDSLFEDKRLFFSLTQSCSPCLHLFQLRKFLKDSQRAYKPLAFRGSTSYSHCIKMRWKASEAGMDSSLQDYLISSMAKYFSDPKNRTFFLCLWKGQLGNGIFPAYFPRYFSCLLISSFSKLKFMSPSLENSNLFIYLLLHREAVPCQKLGFWTLSWVRT